MNHIHIKLFSSVFLVLLLSTGFYAQLPSDPFIAYDGNPVITKIPGTWDSTEIFWPYVTLVNDTFYVTYNGSNDIAYNTAIGLATSTDGYNFTKGSNPILEADGSGFDAYSVSSGLLTFYNSTWYLYYAGRSSGPNIPGTIVGRAFSNTGPHGPWIRSEDTLLAVGSSGEWDSEIIDANTILEIDEDNLVMYYWGCDIWPGSPQIGRATSTDGGLTWVKYDDPTTTAHPYRDSDPVLKPEQPYDICGIFGCTVFKLDSIWEMWYSGSTSGCGTTKINYATSEDGINWDRVSHPNPIFSPIQDTVSQSPIREKPAVIKSENIYYMYYDYGLGGSEALGIGLATADIINSVGSLRENIPTTFTLEQNYPNPFNPSTKIKYTVPQFSRIVITVFDILGNEIETLVDEEKSIGTYELVWNVENLSSGIYFYQMKAGPFIETRKMILLK